MRRFFPLAWRSQALLTVAGLAQAASLAWPGSGATSGCVQTAAMVAFLWVLEQSTRVRQAFASSAWFATVWLSATFWWLFTALHTYGGLPAPLAVLSVVLLAAALGLYYAAAGACYVALRPRQVWARALLWGMLWMAAELARSVWFTGFGWGGVAYAHVESALAAWAPYVGAHGMAAVAAMLAMALCQVLRSPAAWRAAWVVGAACALPAGLQVLAPATFGWSQPQGSLRVSLLQGNIAQEEKFMPQSGVPEALAWYGAQLAIRDADLVIAPETAIPVLPSQLPPGYLQNLQHSMQGGQQALLFGIPMGDFKTGYTNAALGLQPDADLAWQYDKHHLVPFGEFIPPLFKWFTQMMDIPLGDFNRGSLTQPPFVWRGQQLGVTICFEDLFGEELAQRFGMAQVPSMLVNLSNLAWFGQSQATAQHLHISRLRALEFERPMLRATNTGLTAVIDHRGQVSQQWPPLQRGRLTATVQGRTGLTPYAQWASRWGLWPLWGLCGLVLLGCVASRKRHASWLT